MSVTSGQKKEYEKVSHHVISKMHFFVGEMNYRTLHVHTDIEVLQIISGTLEVITPNETFEVKEGEIAYFNPNQPHACRSTSIDPCITLVLQFDPSFCADYFPSIWNLHFETSYLSNVIPKNRMEELKVITFHIGYNFFGQVRGFEFRCMSDVNRLMGYLLAYVPNHEIADEDYMSALNFEKRMERITEYIRSHYSEKITLQEIADREGLSTSYLSHFFKKNLNKTFQTYLNELRFEHAVFLLKNTNKKIIDICIESGFSDSKYLNKYFLQFYNMTPKEFRKTYSGQHEETPSSQIKDGEKIFDLAESLQILRSNHFYECDDGNHPNSIL